MLAVLFAAAALTLVPTSAARAAEDSGVEGSWKAQSAMLGGEALAPEDVQTVTLSLEGGAYEVQVDGRGTTDKGTYTVDDRKKPRRLRIIVASGPNQGRTFPAIYELPDADTLRICYDLAGAKYPDRFEAIYGTAFYVVTYKRVAAAAPSAP
ncbi:MAG TPA: TIGR03067 domain-containing protein [Gaiellaceae bacterium]|nr:TIGR03067 domain-containing protein [Gaiellaceae bacterium]